MHAAAFYPEPVPSARLAGATADRSQSILLKAAATVNYPLSPAEGISPVAARLGLRSAAPGFTLIEMMVVMVLVGITAALMLPEMKGTYEEALLRSASRELVNVFHLAYSRSVSLNRTHRVIIQETTGAYRLERAVSAIEAQPDFVPAREVAGAEGEIDHRVSLRIHKTPSTIAHEEQDVHAGIPDNVFEFYADGTASEGGVLLRDRQGVGLILRINPVTARVRVSPVSSEP